MGLSFSTKVISVTTHAISPLLTRPCITGFCSRALGKQLSQVIFRKSNKMGFLAAFTNWMVLF